MGRKRKNRHPKCRQRQQQKGQPHRGAKRPKRIRCWIEDCPETDETAAATVAASNSKEQEEAGREVHVSSTVDVNLVISRVLLFDDHSSSRVDLALAKDTLAIHKKPEKNMDRKDLLRVDAKEEDGTGTGAIDHVTKNSNEKKAMANSNNEDEDKSEAQALDNKIRGDDQQNPSEGHAAAAVGETTKAASDDNSGALKRHVTSGEKTMSMTSTNETVAGGISDTAKIDTADEVLQNAHIAVRRHASARGAVIFPRTGFVHLPNGDCGDGIVNPFPDTVQDKYWAQRHRLFRRFEEGIQLDQEGWFSVTPEAIARHVAQKMTRPTNNINGNSMIILDAFVGVGGNAIAFAKRQEVALVICVDTDHDRLCMAANNCKVYGIPKEKVMFVCSDAVRVLEAYRNGKRVNPRDAVKKETEDTAKPEKQECDANGNNTNQHGYNFAGIEQLPKKVDAVFLSPPWGGSEYSNQRHFDLESIQINEKFNGDDLLRLAVQAMSKEKLNLAYFLPRNTNGWRIGQSAYRAGVKNIEMEQNYLNHKLKTITLYARAEVDE